LSRRPSPLSPRGTSRERGKTGRRHLARKFHTKFKLLTECSVEGAIPLTLPSPHPLSREPIPRDGEKDQRRGAFEYEICGLEAASSPQPSPPSCLRRRGSGGRRPPTKNSVMHPRLD